MTSMMSQHIMLWTNKSQVDNVMKTFKQKLLNDIIYMCIASLLRIFPPYCKNTNLCLVFLSGFVLSITTLFPWATADLQAAIHFCHVPSVSFRRETKENDKAQTYQVSHILQETPSFELHSHTPVHIATFLEILMYCSCSTPMQKKSLISKVRKNITTQRASLKIEVNISSCLSF